MKVGTVIVWLLFVGSFAIILFSLSAYGQRPPPNGIGGPPRRRNPIRDRYIPKPGLCPQNVMNGTKPGFKLFRMHKKSGQCFPIDEKGPCGRNMLFYRIGNSDFGECDCAHSKRCGRPLIYWEPTDSCYYVNTQGPCKEGHWLIYGLSQKPVCQKNGCLHKEADNPSNHRARKFWTSINGRCMKTRTKGFCPEPEQVMFFKEGEAYPQCVFAKEANVCNTSHRISRPCWAGQKFDSFGNCRDKVGLWGNEDDHGI